MCSPCCTTKNLEDDYVLAEVSKVLISDECITPNTPPRITQPTFGQYLIRKDGKNDYLNQKIHVHPRILDKWADANRGYWVDKCGTNDYFIHELARKYHAKPKSFHPKNVPYKRLIPRPYSCELDCLNKRRLAGMKDIENKYRPAVSKLSLTNKYTKKESVCEFEPPFWWEYDKRDFSKVDPCEKVVPKMKKEEIAELLRWRPVPNVLAALTRTVCERRDEMSLVGQPFHHEACSFYYDHYPAAKLTIFPFRFAK